MCCKLDGDWNYSLKWSVRSRTDSSGEFENDVLDTVSYLVGSREVIQEMPFVSPKPPFDMKPKIRILGNISRRVICTFFIFSQISKRQVIYFSDSIPSILM